MKAALTLALGNRSRRCSTSCIHAVVSRRERGRKTKAISRRERGKKKAAPQPAGAG